MDGQIFLKNNHVAKKHVAKSCKDCQVKQNMLAKALIHPWDNTKTPWVRIHQIFARPYLGNMFLVLVD